MQELPSLRRSAPLAEQVYEALRDLLRSGHFEPAQRLTELGVAGELGVSRTPVREALGQLSREGFLTPLPRGGYAVPAIEQSDIEEMFEVRSLLEPYAAAQAARRCSPATAKRLEDALNAERIAHDNDDPSRFMEANHRFRQVLFEQAGNRRLTRTIETFEDHAQYVRLATLEDKTVRNVVIDGHQRLLDAVRAGDARAAAVAMEAHLAAARRSFIAALDDNGTAVGRSAIERNPS